MFIKQKITILLSILVYIIIYFVRVQQDGWEPSLDLFPSLRQNLDQKIRQLLPSPQSQLLSGILLGNKKDLPYDLRLALRDSSTLHIVVVSGQNLSLVAGFILYLSGLLTRKVAIALSFLAVVFYTLLTGAQIPVLRAAIMVTLASLAAVMGRERDGAWVLVITGSSFLLINPSWITDLSFQLSFLATFGVIVVAPIFLKYFDKIPILGANLAVTLGAQLMVLPIITQNFHQLSIVGILTNLLILWTITPIMIGGILLISLSFIWQLGAEIIAWGLNSLLIYFIFVVQFFGSLPFAWQYVGEKFWVFWIGYYLLISGLLIFLQKITSKD